MTENLTRPNLSEFAKLAREHCCNFQATGPWGIRAYCLLEPPATSCQCGLQHGFFCRWFARAVVSAKGLELEAQRYDLLRQDWEAKVRSLRDNPGESDLKEETRATVKFPKKCSCGMTFLPSSNRQKYCSTCSVRAWRKRSALKQRKYRQKRVGNVTL